MVCFLFFFFFFSSRRRHTRYIGDWSSDVCSSDLNAARFARQDAVEAAWEVVQPLLDRPGAVYPYLRGSWRSEERRVGKECRSGGAAGHEKQKETKRRKSRRRSTSARGSRNAIARD